MPVVRHRRSLAIAVVVVLALSACNDAHDPEVAPSPTTASAAPTPVAPAVVTMVEAGAAPLRVVALDVEEGHTETSILELTSTTASDFMSASSPPLTLVMTIPVTTSIADVGANEITVDVRYGKATVTDGGSGVRKDMLAQATHAVRFIDGVTAREVYTLSGTAVARAVAVGEEAPDFVRRILDDVVAQGFALTVSFPTEEIGVGARWKVVSDITVGGGKVEIASVYQLTELTDGGYVVTVKGTRIAAPGRTVVGRIIEGRATSTGTVRGQAGLWGPIESMATTEGTSTVALGGERIRTTYDVSLRATTK